MLDEIEEALVTSDVGLDTTVKIIEALEERVARDKVMGETEMMDMLYASFLNSCNIRAVLEKLWAW